MITNSSSVIFLNFHFSGWINGSKTLDSKSKAVAAMMFISGALFTVIAVLSVFLLRRVRIVVFSTFVNAEPNTNGKEP